MMYKCSVQVNDLHRLLVDRIDVYNQAAISSVNASNESQYGRTAWYGARCAV